MIALGWWLMFGGLAMDARAQTEPAQRRATAVWRIPAEGEGYRLTAVGAVERLSDGRIVILETVERTLLLFDPSGRFLRKLGRAGDGPGEFTWPQSLGVRADSIWVGDATHRRVTVYGPTLQVARTIPNPVSGAPSLMHDGRVLTVPLENLTRPPVETVRAVSVWLPAGDGAVDTLVAVPVLTRALAIEVGGMQRLSRQPFEDGPLIRVSRDGEGITVIERRADQGRRAAVRVHRIGPTGETRFDIRLPYAPMPVPPSVIAEIVVRFRELIQRRMPDVPTSELDRRIRSALYLPDHAPSVTSALAAQDGSTWLRREGEGRATARWTVLDRRGQVAYELRLPDAAEVLWASGDFFCVSELDGDGLPTVVLYRVQ